jgi:hypothetical protein
MLQATLARANTPYDFQPFVSSGMPLMAQRTAIDSNSTGTKTTNMDFTPPSINDMSHDGATTVVRNNEARYSTMLELIQSSSAGHSMSSPEPTIAKLIGDTNPLSALLRKDLKHRIVTSLCAFRSPEPRSGLSKSGPIRSSGHTGWNWEQFYVQAGVSPVKMRYMADIGCFDLPKSGMSGELLDIFFTRVHPLLPVINRHEFLASYYGMQKPPSLLLLQAIFLVASRYSATQNADGNSNSSVREQCDKLYTKFRALVEIDIVHDRLAVVQASILASLHWEGREGVNSALDSLSLAVRIAQELGLHRRANSTGSSADKQLTQVHKRVWWCVYAMDRFNAAQEGTAVLMYRHSIYSVKSSR